MIANSLRALLARSIDYAGMFPPCSLDLAAALKNQARYGRSDEAWMLSTFVLPIAQFEAAANYVAQFDKKFPLRISALGPKTENAAAFIAELKIAVQAIRSLAERYLDRVSVTQLEMLLPPNPNVALLREARALLGDFKLQCFWEAPADSAEKIIALLAEAKIDNFGFKLRTGGVTADAFPTSAQIARSLVAAARDRVPIKFTAGLHHPIRQFRDEVKTKMHGFLNVLGAGVLAAEYHWDQEQTSRMLEDEDAKSFSFAEKSFAWREHKIDLERIEALRKLVTSFGSCSFDEPRQDLRALGFL